MSKLMILLVVTLSFSASDVLAKKKLYKWVDENGNVSYSDTVQPEQIKKAHEEINEQGVIVDRVGNARTDEEFYQDRLEKLRLRKEAEKQKKLKEKRQNIIKAYTNEKEIIRLKDERLASLKRNIELAEQSLAFQRTSKEELMSRAADNERNGQIVSKALKSRIEIIKEKINYQLKFIEVKKKEIDRVQMRFEKDLKTYREAKEAQNY
jgi:hypothetical protein